MQLELRRLRNKGLFVLTDEHGHLVPGQVGTTIKSDKGGLRVVVEFIVGVSFESFGVHINVDKESV